MNVQRSAMLMVTIMLAGCMIEQEISRTPRTAVEQVLLTQAVERALDNLTVQLPQGAAIEVDATGLDSDRSRMRMASPAPGTPNVAISTPNYLGTMNTPSLDTVYIRDTVAAALGHKGYHIRARDREPQYLVRVMTESLGTMQGITFFGMPPVQSVLIPFALPELTLYKHINQTAYARLHLDVYDERTGEFLGSTAKLIGRSYYHQYTVLFFVTWKRTDITAPP